MSLSVAKTSTLIGRSVTVNNYLQGLYCSPFTLCRTNIRSRCGKYFNLTFDSSFLCELSLYLLFLSHVKYVKDIFYKLDDKTFAPLLSSYLRKLLQIF